MTARGTAGVRRRAGAGGRRGVRVARLAAATVVLALSGSAWAASAEPGPLAVADAETAQRLEAVLAALAHGDARPLRALPATLLLQPLAAPDPVEPALLRRWTARLPPAIAASAARTEAIAALAAGWRSVAGSAGDGEDQAGRALAFLPAPAARQVLAAAADRAFDRGRFPRFLAITSLLGAADDADAPGATAGDRAARAQRRAIALELSGQAWSTAAAGALPMPGVPEGEAGRPAGDADAVRPWRVDAGWLLACDPWGGVRWQRRLPAATTVTPGGGGLALRDEDGAALLDLDGHETARFPLDPGARVLAVAGAALWVAGGTQVQRLAGGVAAEFHQLPEPPLAAPLVRGHDSLWLTAHELVLCPRAAPAQRLLHGLPAGPGWHLAYAGDGGARLIAADGGSWRLPALAGQLAAAPPAARLELLARARRWEEVLDLAQGAPSLAQEPRARRTLLAAWLAHGFPAAADAQVLALADDDGQRARVRWYRAMQPLRTEPVVPGEPAALLALLGAAPEVLLPRDPDRADPGAEGWSHAVTGRAVAAWLRAPGPAWPPACDTLRPLVDLAEAAPGRPPALRFALAQGLESTEISAHEPATAQLRWRHRWAALPVPSGAPNRSLVVRDGVLVVSEGSGRLVVLDPRLGDSLGSVDLSGVDAEPAQSASAGCDPAGVLHVALLHPLGLNTGLTLADSAGHERDLALPAPGRWLVRAPGCRVLVALRDGQGLLVDAVSGAQQRVPLPAALAAAATAQSEPAGVVAGTALFRWR